MAVIRQVNPEMMNEQASALDKLIGSWSESVNEITRLKDELDGMWDGLANSSFNARWTEDLNKYNQLTVTLDNYRRAIIEAAGKYADYEQEIHNIVKD